jgi:chemotaxis signal transduction protein
MESKPNMVNKKLPAQTLESIENEDARFHMISEAAYYITGLGTVGQRMLILVDIEKLMSSRDMELMDEAVV